MCSFCTNFPIRDLSKLIEYRKRKEQNGGGGILFSQNSLYSEKNEFHFPVVRNVVVSQKK